MHYFTLRNSPLADKTVLLRVDFNVPLNEVGNITDNRRIKESLPTIRYLLAENAKMILLSHLGRPEGEIVEKWRLDKVAKELSRLLKHDVRKISDCSQYAAERGYSIRESSFSCGRRKKRP